MSRVSESVAFETAANPIVNYSTAIASTNLQAAVHANRLVVINAELTNASQKFVLPKATGSGDKYTIYNDIVSTQDIVVAVANALDVMRGVAVVFSQTVTESGDLFLTTATDDTYTFNNTTSGGLRGDKFEAIDWKMDSAGTGTWLVEVRASGGGTLATGFSAAV